MEHAEYRERWAELQFSSAFEVHYLIRHALRLRGLRRLLFEFCLRRIMPILIHAKTINGTHPQTIKSAAVTAVEERPLSYLRAETCNLAGLRN